MMSQAKRFRELINNTFEISQIVDGVKTVYVSGDDVQLHIKKHYGSAYCYFDSTEELKADFDHFNRLHVTDFIRLLKALQFDYNPCENFDKYSEITVNHTGTIGNTSNSTVTSKVNAFDSSSLVTDGETSANGGNTTTLNNSDGTNEHTHGNIGVQTVSNMILQSGTGEAYLRFNNFVEHYLNRWVCGCIVAYGDEENEIDFAPNVEYATKSELDNLSSDVVSIADTVATHSETINTLDNSLGGVISDIDNNIKPTLEELIEEVDDHETRITTLENAPSGEIIYSTLEHIIGEWVDGSPLYEKTVDFGGLPNTTTKNVDHGITNIKDFISISGCAYLQNTSGIPLPYCSVNANENVNISVNSTRISVTTNVDRSVFSKSYITIRYTKNLL